MKENAVNAAYTPDSIRPAENRSMLWTMQEPMCNVTSTACVYLLFITAG